MKTKKTIAEICNNPLNIKYSELNVWKGQCGSYKGFVKFTDEKMGWRAACKIILGYMGYGLVTPAAIISRWAPETENNVQAYVDTVCKDGVLLPNVPLRDVSHLWHLMARMALVERGSLGDLSEIRQGFNLAVKSLTPFQEIGLGFFYKVD